MSGGWGNYIMQDEPSFLVLDSSLVLVTAALLTIFHPGIYFPRMINAVESIDGDQIADGHELAHEHKPVTPGDASADDTPRSDV